jgi:hypothetical protein
VTDAADAARDACIGNATRATARCLEQLDREGRPVRERQLQLALAEEIDNAETERRLRVPNWDPQPGATDIVTRDDAGRLTSVIETKLKSGNDIYECLWDFAKVLSLTQGDDRPAGYVVVGTTCRGWARHATNELFNDGDHLLVEAIREHLEWWDKYILGDSTGRPTAVPTAMEARVLAEEPLSLAGVDWELRALRIVGGGGLARFVDGRPQ